ncbi:MAG: ABC transporter substrate-binding protein [Kiloniellaceae bacterium]
MTDFTRRDLLKVSAATALGAVVATPAMLRAAQAWAAENMWKPEAGASLRLLRWKRFVQSEEEAFLAAMDAFTKATGVEIRVDSEGFEDLRPKAAVAANIGSGPDIIWGIHADAHLYPDAMMDVSDVCDYLGGKYGGWYPAAETYGKRDGKWINMPVTISGNLINYRKSMVQKAGFDTFPETTGDFLKLMQNLKANGTPGGFALGNASGDGNSWTHWILWSHGGQVVDKNDKVVLNSPETVAGLEYVKQLGETFIPGAASWLDGHNNKAFLQGDCSVTNNGISIYAAAVREGMTDVAEDMDHAFFPIGPAGKPTELHVCFPMMPYKHTKYPNAVKALMSFLMEKDQYDAFLQGSVGYLSHPLRAYKDHPVWTEDPKRTVFRDVAERTLTFAGDGSLGYAASSVFADFVVVNMVAEAATGTKSPKEAAADAQKRAERYYNV